MTREERIQKAEAAGVEAILRDDICARSAMVGLKTAFPEIPEEMVTASLSLAGGTGSASGSCGAYCAGLLAVGLHFNSTIPEELADPAHAKRGLQEFMEYRDRFLARWGTVLCPKIHAQLFGKEYDLTDERDHTEFLSMPGHQDKCAQVVASAIRMACEMILPEE